MSLKRMRSTSPSSSSPLEQERAGHRPAKRPTLALRIASLDGARRDNDWVQQTGGLHISSPHQSAVTSLAPSTASLSDNGGSTRASPIVTDSESVTPPVLQVTPPVHRPDHPMKIDSPPPSHHSLTPSINAINPSSNLQAPTLSLQTSHLPRHLSGSHAPDIRILPATPSTAFGGANSAPASPMIISPGGSATWSPSSPNSRKAKLTIGPRTDCAKCRDGIKGHWMHFE